MSKINVGVGDEFPVQDVPEDGGYACSGWKGGSYNCGRHSEGTHEHEVPNVVTAVLGGLAAVSLVTLAVLNPLVTLAVTGGGALAYAAGRRSARRRRWWARKRQMWRDYAASTAQDAKYSESQQPSQRDT